MKTALKMAVAVLALMTAATGAYAKGSGEQAATKPMDVYYADTSRTAASGDAAVLDFINRKFNVNFHYTQFPSESAAAKFTTMIASGSNLDFFLGWYADWTNPRSIDRAREQGLIVPLDDLLAKYGANLLKDVDAKYWDLARNGGKIWFVPNVQFKSKRFMYVRQDWLEKIGYAKHPATLEEFDGMLRDLKAKNPGKQPNFYPLIGENFTYLYLEFLGSFVETAGNFVDKDGALKPEYFHPNYKRYLETLQKWYADGLINPDQPGIVRQQEREQIEKGQAGVWTTWFGDTRLAQLQKTDPGAKVTFMKAPVGPSGTGGAQSVGIFSGGGQVIMSHCSPEKQAKIIQMLDWFQTAEGQMFQWYGIKGQHWVMQGDFVGLPAGAEPGKLLYNTFYIVNGGNMYAHFIESVATDAGTRESRMAATSGAYPSIDPADYMLPYDWSKTASADRLTDLDTMKTQMLTEIMTGKKPVSYFDEWLEKWKSAGGAQYLKDLDSQYRKIKK